ncbi:MAG TPA: DUF4245 domain-containing protein [Mycobacteriales bacterium]|nr:DUF4245 domain-containing protein [Mycobacteriales bacterium]
MSTSAPTPASLPAEPAPPVAAAAGTGRPARRGVKTVADMFRSLAVVIVGIAVIFGSIAFAAYRYHGKPQLEDVSTGASSTFDIARAQASFPLLAPPVEPAGWTLTSLRWDGGKPGVPQVLHAGWVTPDERFVDLEESGSDVAPLLAAYVKDPQPAPPVTVEGRAWTVSTNHDGSQTWVAHEGARWIGLTGGGTPAELRVIAAGLR